MFNVSMKGKWFSTNPSPCLDGAWERCFERGLCLRLVGQACLSVCNSLLQTTYPQTRLSPLSGPRYCIAIYNGVLGKATIQSHSLPIDDLNFLLKMSFWNEIISRLTCKVLCLRLSNAHLCRPLWECLFQHEVIKPPAGYIWPPQCAPRYILPTAASDDSSESSETPSSGKEDLPSSAAVGTGSVPVPLTLGDPNPNPKIQTLF